jgi:peptidoglycan/xylan/chitin deacetylase (PgdA/CDA1 family)
LNPVLAFILLPALLPANPFGMDLYEQSFSLEFKTEAAAAKARLELLPLYHGYDQAFSSRWDDNLIDNLKTQELLKKHGLKGTYFMNDSKAWHEPSAAGMTLPGEPGVALAKALLKGGNSIGAHSLNHEFVPYLNRNRQFYEVLGCRLDREVNSQSPLSTYAFSFMSVRNDLEGDPSQKDFAEILKRSGFYLLSEHPFERTLKTDFLMGYLICGDGGGSMGLDLEAELARPRPASDKPLWVTSMHAWPNAWGGPGFPLLDKVYKKWAGKKNWWYCNQNEYAAYRYQYLYSSLSAKVDGKFLRVSLRRPDPLDLGDMVPLSLSLQGVDASQVVAAPPRVEKAGAFLFDLPHAQDRGLPEIYRDSGSSLEASLAKSGNKFTLSLKNNGRLAVKNIRAVLRLPLKYADGLLKQHPADLKPGQSVQLSFAPRLASADYLLLADRAYAVAQLDLSVDGKRERLYSAQFEPAPLRDSTFPQGGFLVLGPLGSDLASKAGELLRVAKPQACSSLDGKTQTCWQASDKNLAAMLGAEIIPAGCKPNSRTFYTWDKALAHPGPNPLYYLLWSSVDCAKTGNYQAVFDKKSVKTLLLNGQKVEGSRLKLKAGHNDLRLLYSAEAGPQSAFSPAHYGAWFRISDEQGHRLKTLSYNIPSLP